MNLERIENQNFYVELTYLVKLVFCRIFSNSIFDWTSKLFLRPLEVVLRSRSTSSCTSLPGLLPMMSPCQAGLPTYNFNLRLNSNIFFLYPSALPKSTDLYNPNECVIFYYLRVCHFYTLKNTEKRWKWHEKCFVHTYYPPRSNLPTV